MASLDVALLNLRKQSINLDGLKLLVDLYKFFSVSIKACVFNGDILYYEIGNARRFEELIRKMESWRKDFLNNEAKIEELEFMELFEGRISGIIGEKAKI